MRHCGRVRCDTPFVATILQANAQELRRIAVNLRLADLGAVARIAIDRFDGLGAFEDLPRDGHCVADYWF